MITQYFLFSIERINEFNDHWHAKGGNRYCLQSAGKGSTKKDNDGARELAKWVEHMLSKHGFESMVLWALQGMILEYWIENSSRSLPAVLQNQE